MVVNPNLQMAVSQVPVVSPEKLGQDTTQTAVQMPQAPVGDTVNFSSGEQVGYAPAQQEEKSGFGFGKFLLLAGLAVGGLATHKAFSLNSEYKALDTIVADGKKISDTHTLSKFDVFMKSLNPFSRFKNADNEAVIKAQQELKLTKENDILYRKVGENGAGDTFYVRTGKNFSELKSPEKPPVTEPTVTEAPTGAAKTDTPAPEGKANDATPTPAPQANATAHKFEPNSLKLPSGAEYKDLATMKEELVKTEKLFEECKATASTEGKNDLQTKIAQLKGAIASHSPVA